MIQPVVIMIQATLNDALWVVGDREIDGCASRLTDQYMGVPRRRHEWSPSPLKISPADRRVQALRSGSTRGAATNVFAKEPSSSATSPLLGETPTSQSRRIWHGWLSQRLKNYQRVLIENLCAFLDNKSIYLVAAAA